MHWQSWNSGAPKAWPSQNPQLGWTILRLEDTTPSEILYVVFGCEYPVLDRPRSTTLRGKETWTSSASRFLNVQGVSKLYGVAILSYHYYNMLVCFK